MDRSGSRFKNHLDDNLVHLHKNLYISSGDPLYYEKVIRYLDAHSPEAHFKLGQNYQRKGILQKAQFHYQEALRTYPSPYYSAANKALKQITIKMGEKQSALESAASVESANEARSPLMSMMLIILLLLNILIISLYFGADSISKTISKLKPWSIGTDVTYETTEIPYLMNFPYDSDTGMVETAIHKEALDLAKEHPKQNIIIYGIASSSSNTENKIIPLLDQTLTSQAFVIAEYNSSIDKSVKVRFLDPETKKKQPLSSVGANLVRTALNSYIQDFGKPPGTLDQLLQDYPHNYLSFIPLEASSHTNSVSSIYNGRGGWVYDAASANIGTMFFSNDQQETSPLFEPIHIEIVKSEHSLRLLAGTKVIMEMKVGLGANGQTPEDHFAVIDRVLDPLGSKQGVYGTAGLGLGKYAIHGTNDESSIGSNQSLGCIRLSNSDMNQLFAFVPKGTHVDVTKDNPNSTNQGEKLQTDLGELIPANFLPIQETPLNQAFHWLG